MTNQKVAIVTGGSSGIGRATAIALAKEGVKIVVAARRAKEGEETVNLVRKAGSDGIFVKTDVADEVSVRSLMEKTVRSYGRLDYAFNNAGVEQTMTPLVEQTVEEFDQIMNINVKGVWLSMKYEIQVMLKSGDGAIVNNSSVTGIMGFPQMAIYIASKHAACWTLLMVLTTESKVLTTLHLTFHMPHSTARLTQIIEISILYSLVYRCFRTV